MARTNNSTVDNDKLFITMLKECNKLKTPKATDLNPIIRKHFPKTTFGKAGMSNYFINFIPYQMNIIKSENLETILDLLDPLMYKLYAPDKTNQQFGTLDNKYSSLIRNHIKKRFGKDSNEYTLSLQLTALTDADKLSLIKFVGEKMEKRFEKKIEYDPDEVLKQIADNITHQNVFYRSIALLLASGSRPIELYAKSTYEIPQLTSKGIPFPNNWIRQNYIAKDRGDKSKAFVEKPILYISPETFIKELKKVRKELKDRYGELVDADDQMKTSVMTPANEAAKNIFSYQEDFVQYTARPLYGLVSYEYYGRKPNIFSNDVSINEWIKRVLGHAGLDTSMNYRRFKLKYPEKSDEDLKIKQLEIENKIEVIEQRLDENEVPNKADVENTSIKKNSGMSKQYDKLRKIANENKGTNGKLITSSKLEVLGSPIASRSIIRSFYKILKNEALD